MLVIALFALAMMASCATIVSGGQQDVRFETDPSGASVRVFDGHESMVWSGTTPANALLNKGDGYFRGASYRVEIELEGYDPVTVFITPEINVWYAGGNFLFGGLIGWLIVDPATGAMWTLSPEIVNRDLSQSASSTDSGDVMIVLRDDVPQEMVAFLQPLPSDGQMSVR